MTKQNEITSADDLNKQGRKSDVLVAALEKCEKLEAEIKELKSASDKDYKDLRRFQGLLIQNKDEINKLKEQLKIAVEALKWIYEDTKGGHIQCDACNYTIECEGCVNQDVAEQALKQIKELNNDNAR